MNYVNVARFAVSRKTLDIVQKYFPILGQSALILEMKEFMLGLVKLKKNPELNDLMKKVDQAIEDEVLYVWFYVDTTE